MGSSGQTDVVHSAMAQGATASSGDTVLNRGRVGVLQDARLSRTVVALGLLLSTGCVTPRRAERAALKSLKVLQVAAEDTVEAIDKSRTARMEACDRATTEAEAMECMGALGKPIAPKVGELSKAYDSAVDAVRAMTRLVDDLIRMQNGVAP